MILRRSLFGYRRADVERIIEQLHTMAASLERVWLERESLARDLGAARLEIEQLRLTERSRLVRAEADARAMSARLLAQAEEQAFEIRRRVTAEAADATARLDELLRTRERLLDELGAVVEQAQVALASTRPRAASAPPSPEPVAYLRPGTVEDDRLFSRTVLLDVGPFDDYAALSSFERALGALPTVRDVYIRQFDGPRALIELSLGERRALLRDLSRHVPYSLDVRDTSESRLTLEVESLPLAAAERR